MNEDLGIIMFDGKMYNLDEMGEQELEELQAKLLAEKRNVKEKIDNELYVEKEMDEDDFGGALDD